MQATRWTLVALLGWILMAGMPLPREACAAEPRVGELHPEIRLPTIDGKHTVSLRAFRGKKVLLIQFASW